MGNFNRYNNRSRSDSGVRQMHRTTCSNCGKECEVPFKPTGSKPVFCSECFERNGGGESRRFGSARFDEESRRGGRGQRRPSFEGNRSSDRPQNNEQFNALNFKLDKILAILIQKSEKPASKPEPQEVEDIVIAPEEPVLVVKKKTK